MLFFSTVGDGGVRTTLTHQRHMGQRQQEPRGKMKYHLLCKKQREGTLILVKEKQALFQKEQRPCPRVNSLSLQELYLDGSQTVHTAPSNDL